MTDTWDAYSEAVKGKVSSPPPGPKTATTNRTIIVGKREITIEHKRVYSLTAHNSNAYKIDDHWVAASDLTPEERGHTYETEFHKDHVTVSNSRRIWDKEADEIIRGLGSVRNGNRDMVQRLGDNPNCHRGPALDYSFRIDLPEYNIFKSRAERVGWAILENRPTVEKLTEIVSKIGEVVPYLTENLKSVAEACDKVLKEKPRKISDLKDWSTKASALFQRASELVGEATDAGKLVALAYNEAADLERVEGRLNSEAEVQKLLVDRWTVTGASCAVCGDEAARLRDMLKNSLLDSTNVMKPTRSLHAELCRLVRFYPFLSEFIDPGKCSDSVFTVKILGTSIMLSEKKIQAGGDSAELLRILQGETVVLSRPKDRSRKAQGRFRQWKTRHQ